MSLTAQHALADWLAYIERQHAQPIALGLDRVREVLGRMGVRLDCPIITVGGTNGKGSTCAMLEAILRAAGYRVGMYTSPHLRAYNERVRIGGGNAADSVLTRSFAAVERARADTPLTYFEFGTLAAFEAFAAANVEVAILEVGLGGRLDAVNVLDPDVAVVTGIALDHMAFLGDTREAIGFEKAGIFRSGRPAICADPQPPASLVDHAGAVGADLRLLGRDFGYSGDRQQWQWWGRHGKRSGLAYPALRGANQLLNASAALAALEALAERLPVSMQAVREGLIQVVLPGRFQVVPGQPTIILDVAHNPQSAGVLAENLSNSGYAPRTFAVVSMLADKDVEGAVRLLDRRVDRWYACGLSGPRTLDAGAMAARLGTASVSAEVRLCESVARGLSAAREDANPDDRIVVFGSFLTVAAAMDALGV